MEIFRVNREHLDEVARLFDLYRQFYEQKPDLEACRDYLGKRLQRDESVIFAARNDDGEFLGFTQLYHGFCSVAMGETITLYDLYVEAQARRMGIAEKLMNRAREYAESCGVAFMTLETATDNYPGQALYEKLGWERDTEFYTYHLPIS